MLEKHPNATGGYLPLGIIVGSFVGVAVYGVTQYIPAIGFGPLLGLTVAIWMSRFLPRKP
jgi:hypothetical protein